MTATSAMLRGISCKASIAICLTTVAMAAQAQNSITIFPYSVVRLSTNGVTATSPDTFSTSTLSLNCSTSPIAAKVSSTVDNTGNVLVDNFINLTVSQGTVTTGPTNICSGGVVEGNGTQDCFTPAYQTPAGNGQLNGQDPDNFTSTGGVAPIDISGNLLPGANQVTIALVDTGGYLASSSIYLNTNCSPGGVAGGGQINGNPISSGAPGSPALTQTFAFSSADNLNVQQVLDYSGAAAAGTLVVTPGTIPTVTDQAIDPKLWHNYVKGTSFATTNCLIHNGELLNNEPACKLYTVTCQVGQGASASGAQCPSSTARNIVFQDVFDFPDLHLPDVHVGTDVFHQGFGYLMASEGWTGGPCTFDPDSEQIFSCPDNLLTQFTGPGAGRATGTPSPHINSSFISVGPVPEDRTDICFQGYENGTTWVNSRTVPVKLSSTPPAMPRPNNNFTAEPIYGITYGVSLADALPSTEFPVSGDLTIYNPDGCPGVLPAKSFRPDPVSVTVNADGNYLVHYFATDCAGTEELLFYKDSTKSWNTTFYTAELNVDTVKPEVVHLDLLTPPTIINGKPAYCTGETVKASYRCTDSFSGVALCGDHTYSEPVTNPPARTSVLDTSSTGTHTYTVGVKDAARNVGQSLSVTYTVDSCVP